MNPVAEEAPAPMDDSLSALLEEDLLRYGRNLRLEGFGVEGQLRLKRSRVLVVGLGGLGSPAVFYLAAAGVGSIGLVDGDRVDLSNLQRQILYGDEDVGRPKVEAAYEILRHRYHGLSLWSHGERLTEQTVRAIVEPYDFVVEATDNFESKFLINDACVCLGKPFSHAAVSGYLGQAMTVLPGFGPCYRCIFGSVPEPGAVTDPEEEGTLGMVPGVLGVIQATEAVKYLTGLGRLLVGRLFTWNALTLTAREVPLPPEPTCRICRGGTVGSAA